MDRTGVGFLIVAFVAVVIGLTLLLQAAGYVGIMTGTQTLSNYTAGTVPADGSTLELIGQNIVGTAIATNATDGVLIPSTNYTVTQGLGADGQIAVIYTAVGSTFDGESLNISYTYEPDGYVTSSAGRAIAGLIILFGAMGIAFVAFPDLRGLIGFK